MLLKDLQTIGFSKNLSNVYLTLFDLGESRAGDIIRRTGFHRNIVYTALDQLEEKKLVAKTQTRGVARYQALDPERLLGEVEEKRRKIEEIIEELKLKHEVQSQEIVIYEGKEEMQRTMRKVYENMREGERMCILGGTSSYWFDAMGKKNIEYFVHTQKKRKFVLNLVGAQPDDNERHLKEELGDLIAYKILPRISSKTIETIVLKDRVIMLIFVEPYTAIEIINQEIVENHQNFFDLLWEDTTQHLTGEEGVKIFFDDIANCDTIYWIGGSRDGMDTYFPDLAAACKKTRLEKNIIWYDLLDPDADLAGVGEQRLNDEPNYHFKYLSEHVASPHVIGIYGNKVANIIWKDGGFINIIENEEIALGYKKHFDYLWNQEVKTYTGWEEVLNLFNNVILKSLKKGDIEYVIGAGYGEERVADKVEKLFEEHNTYLVQHSIKKHVLMYERYREKFTQEVKDAGDEDFAFIKTAYLPDVYSTPVEIHIFKHMAVMTYFGEKPVSIVYEHPQIIASYKKQFDMLWTIAKE